MAIFNLFSDWYIAKMLTLSHPIPVKEREVTYIFIFTLVCGASKGFMKALKPLFQYNFLNCRESGRVNIFA